jgi:hypothetical protein
MIERHADAHGHLRDALADHKTWVVQQLRQEERMREEHREQLHNNVQDMFENTNKRFQQEVDRVYDHQQRDLSTLAERVDSHRSDVESRFCAETVAREQLHDRVSARIDKAKEETADELARQVARQDAQLRDSRQTLSEQKHSLLQDLAAERAARADDRKAVDQHFEKLRADRQKDIANMSATQAGTVENFRSLLEQTKEDQRALETRLKMIMGDIRGEFMRDCSDLRSSIAEVQQTKHVEHNGDVKRAEFDQETQRLWEALDTHTHNIDEDKKVRPPSINHSPVHVFEGARSVPLRKHPILPVPEVATANHMVTPPSTPAVATTPIATAIFPTLVSPQLCSKKPLERSPGIVVRNASTVGSVGIKAGSVPAPMPPAIHLVSGSPVTEPLPCSSRAQ